MCFSFLFVFHAKSATNFHHRIELPEISYLSFFSQGSNDIKDFSVSIKTGVNFLIFLLFSSEKVYNSLFNSLRFYNSLI